MEQRSHELIRGEHARIASWYDRRWARYVSATQRETLSRLEHAMQAGHAVLDIGCGTGSLLAELVERGPGPGLRLVGLDLSPAMLAEARHKLPPRVALVEGSAERLPFVAGSFDVVVSTSVYHFWRRPERALSEIARVLRPGGFLALTDWCDDYWSCWLCDRWLRLVNPAHFRIVGSRACREALALAGFRDVRLESYKISWLWGLMTATGLSPADCGLAVAAGE